MITPDLVRLSPNYNKDAEGGAIPMPIGSTHTVIIHCTRSGQSMNPDEFVGTLNYMQKVGTVSSHWVISRAGVKCRVVADNRQAWHAAEDNDNSWGVELEQGVETDGFTPAQMTSLLTVCRAYRDDFGVVAVRVMDSHTPGFIGHQDTVQGHKAGKSDPGVLFPWVQFITDLQVAPVPVPPPDYRDVAAALASGVHFLRNNIDPAHLSPLDKQMIEDFYTWVHH